MTRYNTFMSWANPMVGFDPPPMASRLSKLDENRCAIYYHLANGYEAAGDKKYALVNFMEIYGFNIDFRDVASRSKALKS